MKKSYNVVVEISCTICVDAEDERDAIETVEAAISNGKAETLADVRNAVDYSLDNGYAAVNDAVAVDE